MTPKPLLPSMLHVLRLMAEGWELGFDTSGRSDGRWWIQKGGLGHGGATEELDVPIVEGLIRRKLIERAPGNAFGKPASYRLTAAGKEAARSGLAEVPKPIPRTLKVWRIGGFRNECPRTANGNNQTHEIVAAKSASEAARLFGTPYSNMKKYGGETGNEDDVRIAMSSPGTVFWRPVDERDRSHYVRAGEPWPKAWTTVHEIKRSW